MITQTEADRLRQKVRDEINKEEKRGDKEERPTVIMGRSDRDMRLKIQEGQR